MKVLGIVIAYKNLERAEKAKESALQNRGRLLGTPFACDVIVHDNTEVNENIHVIWNLYLKQADEKGYEFFFILNPDTTCEPDWLSRMLKIMHFHPRICAVGPSTDHCYNEQQGHHPSITELTQGSWVPNTMVPGFCTVFRTKAVSLLGGWREDFEFYGGDLDLIRRLHLAGIMSAWSVDAFVWHEWGGSSKALGEEAYIKLRQRGNLQLEEALREYGLQAGFWVAQPGGGVRLHVQGEGIVQVQGEDHAGGGGGERPQADEEAAGAVRPDRLGEEANQDAEKEGLTPEPAE